MWNYKTYEEIRAMEPMEQVYHLCGRGMWMIERLSYSKDTAEFTKRIVEAAGMDPKKATADDLDDAKDRFVVFTGAGSSTMTVVGWRCLVSCTFAGLPWVYSTETCIGHWQVR